MVPAGVSMAQFALRWILMFEEVSLAIPGAKNSKQAADNLVAADLPAIDEKTMDAIRKIYDRSIRAQVHQRW